MKKFSVSITALFFFVFSGFFAVRAQEQQEKGILPADTLSTLIDYYPEQDWDLFGREEVIEMTLRFDMRKYFKNARRENPEYQKAILIIHAGDTSITKETKIRARGEFRRRYCAFPPIKLNVKKTDFDNEYLEDQKTFKVVTHCKNSHQFEAYLLKEYLIYKLYNQLTDLSFGVRLLELIYQDAPENSKRPKKSFEKFAFLIEPILSVADRNHLVELKMRNLTQKNMEPNQMALVAMFEYMIGNTDWSIPGRHNIKILKALDINRPKPYPVPYDFDYSGMVSANYAIPAEGLPITSVRDRYYRGICFSEEVTRQTRQIFLDHKADLFSVIRDFGYLSNYKKKDMLKYLRAFYNILESESSFRYNIIKHCLR